jgi:hypothetical protein
MSTHQTKSQRAASRAAHWQKTAPKYCQTCINYFCAPIQVYRHAPKRCDKCEEREYISSGAASR